MDIAADTEFSEYMHGRWGRLVRLGYGLTGDRQLAEDLGLPDGEFRYHQDDTKVG